jgi:Cu/Ag efflux pump CusA
MIRKIVDFALNNRFIVLFIAALLFGWGAISFHNLPVEAYPDVANNYVTLITQWPGRAAEEVERDDDLRRRQRERLESREGAGAAVAGDAAE